VPRNNKIATSRASFSHAQYAFDGRTVLNFPREKIRLLFFLDLIEPGNVIVNFIVTP